MVGQESMYFHHYWGGRNKAIIDCSYNGLGQATTWFEDAVRKWAFDNREKFGTMLRKYATDVRDNGGHTPKVLADTYWFANKWTKFDSKDASWSMFNANQYASALLYAFQGQWNPLRAALIRDAKVYTVNQLVPTETSTDNPALNFYYYDMAHNQINADDQTHHFAFYFNVGMESPAPVLGPMIGSAIQRKSSTEDPGDVLLAYTAAKLAREYWDNPSDDIREKILDALSSPPGRNWLIPDYNASIDAAEKIINGANLLPGAVPTTSNISGSASDSAASTPH